MAISLKSIAKTKHAAPPRMLIHGPEKVGKSTFGAEAPAPIFIRTEDGLNGIDAEAFPLAQSYQDVYDALAALCAEQHEYRSVVVDSADWLERLIHGKVLDTDPDGKKTMEAAHGGYGKAYQVALTYWREVLGALDYLNKEKGMIVIVICHSVVVQFNDPEHEPYDRYEMKLHQPKKQTGARDMLCEWADVIGFAQRKIFVSKKDSASGDKVARGVNAGESNKLHLVGSPAFVAGNRYSLPAEIDLHWSQFEAAMSATVEPKKSPKADKAA